nr:hypothetical protein [Tanacetum cinerariifolium]
MAPLTFADTHTMVAYFSKSDASASFDQVVDFLKAQVIQYALMVISTIYVSCIKQFWTTASIKKPNDVVKLQALINGKKVVVTKDVIRQDLHLDDAVGVECLPNEDIFIELALFKCKKDCVERVQLFHGICYHLPCYRVGKCFSRVETPLFASMMVQPQPQAVEGEDDVEVPAAPTPPSPINAHSPPPQDPIEEKEIKEFRVKKVKEGRKIEAIDANKDITLVDMDTQCDIDAELQGRIDDNVASKDVNAIEPTVFDDEEVTMTMAQTLIKMKAEKARLLDEQIAKRLHDEEVKQAAAREKQEKDD